jgi:phosphoesterase RecJ-like protein
MSHKGRAATAGEVAERLRHEARVLLVTHEAPDGDALGCVSALLLMCDRLGVACEAFVPGESGFPDEYRFLPRLAGVVRGSAPAIGPDTTVYFLDCASLLRGDADGFAANVLRVNIDHHQDNPSFGDLNLVDNQAASTTSILHEVFKSGGYPVDAEVATALYVGLLTDTGKFQYSNTTPRSHRIAAELQELGCDINSVSREVYESVPLAKVVLLERMLSRLEIRLQGALVTSWLGNDDYIETGAHEGHGEGLIDTLRCIVGVRVAALARERRLGERVETKVSLRSTDGTVDVAALAHERGGGGHVRAAGFTTQGPADAVLDWVERSVGSKL